jgi:hypothetical protein
MFKKFVRKLLQVVFFFFFFFFFFLYLRKGSNYKVAVVNAFRILITGSLNLIS